MRRTLCSCVMVLALGAVGCQESTEAPPIRSLVGSGKASLLCRAFELLPKEAEDHGVGRDMRACPESDDPLNDDGEERHTIALLTQTLRGEVAVIDLHGDDRGVLDQDPYVPGKEFLTVGAMPTAIVSTPGGTATFVGVQEANLEAIYALPTTCIVPPDEGEPARDILLWSACRLPSRPGEMAIVADPTLNDSGDDYRTTCGPAAADAEWRAFAERSTKDRRKDCAADLENEQQTGPRGRRKLVVTLPDEGKIAIYDAQAILNLPAGSFMDCVPDRVIALSSTVGTDAVVQPIPADMVSPASCPAQPPRYTELDADPNATARPAGIALSGSTLYVADQGVPLVHTVDLSDPCAAVEGEPLRPTSYNNPGRRVLTRDVAVSDPVPSGKQYVYAVDDAEATSMMAFDVSKGSTSRAPILRNNVPYLPLEAPDRITFESPIKDLAIVKHDVPAVTAEGTAEIGVLCDPNPKAEEPGSLYRTDSDYTDGAGPRKLRGLFGMAALANGQIAAIDIEDWDAPCRRPVTNNQDKSQVDWLGCANDPTFKGVRYEDGGAKRTVTDESSCNVIEPHRVRSGRYFATNPDVGTYAASLDNVPLLTGANEAAQRAGNVDRTKASPKMLAVPFEPVSDMSTPPYLFVGNVKYESDGSGQSMLAMDPKSTEQNSLLLPMFEPRVYASREAFSATFEGVVVAERQNGLLPTRTADYVVEGLGRPLAEDELLLEDTDALFCDQGVQDANVASLVGGELGITDAEGLAKFAASHGDFVVLLSDFDDEDPYFKAQAKVCDEAFDVEDGDLATACEGWFGTAAEPSETRELMIREAYHNKLVLAPRKKDAKAMQRLHCCFPSARQYEIRAEQQWVVRGNRLLHDIIPDSKSKSARCIRDCSPRATKLKNRLFEISSSSADCAEGSADTSECWIGRAEKDAVCVLPGASGGVKPGELPNGCVFDFLKGRFAIYRGLVPSIRDMAFSWTVSGGFAVLATSLGSASTGFSVMPEQMTYSESLDSLVVVDGQSGGLSLFGLGSFTSSGEPYQ